MYSTPHLVVIHSPHPEVGPGGGATIYIYIKLHMQLAPSSFTRQAFFPLAVQPRSSQACRPTESMLRRFHATKLAPQRKISSKPCKGEDICHRRCDQHVTIPVSTMSNFLTFCKAKGSQITKDQKQQQVDVTEI